MCYADKIHRWERSETGYMPSVFAVARIVPGIFCVDAATSNAYSRESIVKSEGGCLEQSSNNINI